MDILELEDREDIIEETFDDDCCPHCGSYLIHQGGCKMCMNCGYSACDV